MYVNRPSSPMYPQEPLDASFTTKTLDADSAGGAPKANLKYQITQRSEDYLQRLRSHGTLLQKRMAEAAFCAMRDEKFMPNPARDKPVSQFGIPMKLEERKGILLANFIPHDDKLELVVLGFYAQRYFDSEAGSTHNVVLEHARELPEVQTARSLASLASTRQRQDLRSNNEGEGRAQLTKTNESATGAKSARDEPSEADIVAARNELKKELSRFESQSMYRQMAHKLADNRIKDGRSGSRLTALPIAHASVLGGLARSQAIALASNILTQATTVADSISTQMPEPLRQMIAQRVPSPTPAIKAPIILANANRRLTTPRGQQYQISKKEFVNFYEDRWLLDPENASADEKGDSTAADLEREELTIEQTVDPSGTAGSMLRERRNGLLIKGQNLQVLKRLLAQNASPVGRRDARLIESDMVGELKEMLGDAESLRNKRSSDVS